MVLVLVIIFSAVRILEATVLLKGQEPEENTHHKTIMRHGQAYYPRQDITVLMVLGIDKYGPAEPSQYYRNEGSADTVVLLILDETNKESRVLCLNRDTMLYVDTVGVTMNYAGTEFKQLALAHTYGTGMEDSCENVRSTLMRYLHGLTVDYYISMRMDVLPIINDAVGGVSVNVVDDFENIPKGQVTLRGEQATTYIRTRMNVGDQLNLTRMGRQKEYVASFIEKLREHEKHDSEFILSVYEEVAPYLVSDCPVNTLTTLMDKYLEFPLRDVIIPEGQNVVNKGYYEFYPDEEKLEELILDLFYAPK